MVPNHKFSRIDISEIRDLLIRKIGHQRAGNYFDKLDRFFSGKISKCEFNKFCIRILGRENIPINNTLIRSILKNASAATVPPVKSIRKAGGNLHVKVGNGYQRNCLQSLYGDAFPPPRKGRSPVNRERKFRDRPSPLGPHGKPSITDDEFVAKMQEHQSPTELLSLGSRPPMEVASVEDGEEVEQVSGSPCIQSRSPVTAPFGVCINFGGARKAIIPNASVCSNNNSSYYTEAFQKMGELPDTRSLAIRLEQKLKAEGINISIDCVNLLNNGLDTYLKRLIEPCMGLAKARHGNEQTMHSLNGMMLQGRYIQRPSKSVYATMTDFSASMELNPQLLGEDWPLQLEKISLLASEQ